MNIVKISEAYREHVNEYNRTHAGMRIISCHEETADEIYVIATAEDVEDTMAEAVTPEGNLRGQTYDGYFDKAECESVYDFIVEIDGWLAMERKEDV